MRSEMGDDIIYRFPNLNIGTIEVWIEYVISSLILSM